VKIAFPYVGAELLGRLEGLLRRGVGHDDEELFAAVAAHEVRFPHIRVQPVRQGFQGPIARVVSVLVFTEVRIQAMLSPT